jgi:hypothetical protein
MNNTTNTTDTNIGDDNETKSLQVSLYLLSLLSAFTLILYFVRQRLNQYEADVAKAKLEMESQTFRFN